MNDLILINDRKWLIENPTPRIPVVLCLDCSPSMSGDPKWGAAPDIQGVPIDELNAGVQQFFEIIKEDEIANKAVEVSIVGFSSIVEHLIEFGNIYDIVPPKMELEMQIGGTSIGKAVDMSLKLLSQRKFNYKNAGVDFHKPWLILMTDGYPTDDTHKQISKKVMKLVESQELTVFPIGIGSKADTKTLRMFSPNREPLTLKNLKFKDFFDWLSQSVSKVSQSMPGEDIELDVDGIKNWARL